MSETFDVEAVSDALLEASKALVGIAQRTLPSEPRVTLAQFRALTLLDGEEGMRSADLADALGVSPSTATRLCDRLVRAALVNRVASEDDRREVRLSLTPSGTLVVRDGLARRRRALSRLVAKIPAEDRAPFVRGLRAFEGAGLTDKEPAWALGWRGPAATETTSR
jgi:DNA-binding MarR family transcriptional regulator